MPARKQTSAKAPAAQKRGAAPAAKRRTRATAAADKAPTAPVVVAPTAPPEPAANVMAAAPGPFVPQVSEEQAKAIADRIVAAVAGSERAQNPVRTADVKPGMLVFVRMAAGAYGGEPMERGRVFRLKGLPGDERMVRLGYFMRHVAELHGPVKACRVCGREFVTERDRDGHGAKTHEVQGQERPATLDLSHIPEADRERAMAEFRATETRREEMREEREDERLMRETPPMLENSTATLQANA